MEGTSEVDAWQQVKPLIFEDLHVWLRKTFRRSEPKGWWVGPRAAEGWKRRELVLREAGHKGRSVGGWR